MYVSEQGWGNEVHESRNPRHRARSNTAQKELFRENKQWMLAWTWEARVSGCCTIRGMSSA